MDLCGITKNHHTLFLQFPTSCSWDAKRIKRLVFHTPRKTFWLQHNRKTVVVGGGRGGRLPCSVCCPTMTSENRRNNGWITILSVVVYATLLFFYGVTRLLQTLQRMIGKLSWLLWRWFQQYSQAFPRPRNTIQVDSIQDNKETVTREEFQQLVQHVKILSEIVARHNIQLRKLCWEETMKDTRATNTRQDSQEEQV